MCTYIGTVGHTYLMEELVLLEKDDHKHYEKTSHV